MGTNWDVNKLKKGRKLKFEDGSYVKKDKLGTITKGKAPSFKGMGRLKKA